MIKREDLKTGDVLTDSDGSTHIFIGLNPDHNDSYEVIVLSNSVDFICDDTNEPNKLRMSYVLQQVTSWKRDGVELLKPDKPEQEEFVFCPIEKTSVGEFTFVDQFSKIDQGCTRYVKTTPLLTTSGDYTFIGYCDKNTHPTVLAKTPINQQFDAVDTYLSVYPYAVFMLTSKLEIGGR